MQQHLCRSHLLAARAAHDINTTCAPFYLPPAPASYVCAPCCENTTHMFRPPLSSLCSSCTPWACDRAWCSSLRRTNTPWTPRLCSNKQRQHGGAPAAPAAAAAAAAASRGAADPRSSLAWGACDGDAGTPPTCWYPAGAAHGATGHRPARARRRCAPVCGVHGGASLDCAGAVWPHGAVWRLLPAHHCAAEGHVPHVLPGS